MPSTTPFDPQGLLAAAATATTVPSQQTAAPPSESGWFIAVAVLVAAASVGVAWLLGLIRPARLGAGDRIPPDRPLRPLVGVLLAAVVFWMVAPTLFLRPGKPAPGQPVTTAPGASTPSLRQLVVVNATIPIIAFAVLAVGDILVRQRVGQRLGFDATRVPRGVVAGVVGTVFTLPVVYCAMIVSEVVYRRVGYEHPSEHDLLRAMGEAPADPVVKYLAILAAVVVAPLWEELLFRGHVQTLIRAAITRMRQPMTTQDVTEIPQPPARPGETLEYFAATPLPAAQQAIAPAPRPEPFDAVAATVITAAMFASVHPAWTWPAIFVLSLCLGIAYERTNNLWVPVVMHASFNGLMTTYFLVRGMMN